jgi:uncharacterized membrane protein
MFNIALVAFQFLHILLGSIFIGSLIYLRFVLWPGLLTRSSEEARTFYETILKKTNVLLAASGGLNFILGVIRGTLLGQLRSAEAWGTPYGITFSIALLATLVLLILSPRLGPALLKKVWSGTSFVPGAAKKVNGIFLFPLLLILVILACMVLMHFGF